MLFSVCICSVRPSTLPVAIASIRAQTARDWQLIVVGQGTDQRLHAVGAAAARAEDLGVFGAPTFIFRGELFWGGDRMDLLASTIAQARA